ncbi:Protein of unknown function [Pyronema omphalodes CBS 100304]|uniref:Uncharacterized protein n=1 Tax=Pyronema omphalodes (strain CBS 100304) TaxID=1076935 RepID=U4LBE3_PYROM|nr:Protein of unknown function [Pyronema omphalodes CBS 100304]
MQANRNHVSHWSLSFKVLIPDPCALSPEVSSRQPGKSYKRPHILV